MPSGLKRFQERNRRGCAACLYPLADAQFAFSLPAVSFQFDASSLNGGSNGKAANNYALVYSYAIPEGGYTANSNIQGYSDSVMGDWAFQYDTLNRLTSAVPAPNAPSLYVNTTACWSYDAFGNRTIASFVTSTDCSGASVTSKFDSANHITFVSQTAPISYSAPSGFTYDSGGNVQWDPNNTYAYDSEGRLCAVLQSALNGGHRFQYLYDASGARVAKASFTGAFPAKNSVCAAPGAETGYQLSNQYLINLAGEQVTELGATGNWLRTNVWSGAHLNATYDAANGGALHFHLSDPLGTRRVQVDQNGKIEETCQELPFGDQLNCQIAAGAPNTADDATEHHFTGKERDAESGNDYFGARYYASTMGRFLSPDQPFADQHPANPQSWNLYFYTRNNPLRFVDDDGEAVKESSKIVTYDVHGATAAEARSYALQHSGITEGGEVFMGVTNASMRIPSDSMQINQQMGGEEGTAVFDKATITSADVDLTVVITMPKWVEEGQASSEDQKSWDSAMDSLQGHENGHKEIAEQGAAALDKSLPGTKVIGTGTTSSEAQGSAMKKLSTAVSQKAKANVAATNDKQKQYDTQTDHGRKQP